MLVVKIEPDHESFRSVGFALDAEADGRNLNEDMAELLGDALRPAIQDVRGALFAGSGGLPHAGEPLRQAIAAHLVVDVRVGRAVSARIRALKEGMPRNFWNAPKRFNERRFRHPVHGKNVWVSQIGAPGWFDDTMARNQARYRIAVRRALDKMAERIGRKG